MKPNNKAIEAGVKLCWDCPRATPSIVRDILEAAYAAQFQSEEYAGLIARLRKVEPNLPGERTRWYRNPNGPDAADALEAVLAERDALKAELAKAQEITRMQAERIGWHINEQEKRDAVLKPRTSLAEAAAKERDALAARLAPVEDKELVEIAAKEMQSAELAYMPAAAIAAVRPHIEAAERERCAKIADKHEHVWHSELAHPCARAIAAAIRSGK